jgi:hypothetical protein
MGAWLKSMNVFGLASSIGDRLYTYYEDLGFNSSVGHKPGSPLQGCVDDKAPTPGVGCTGRTKETAISPAFNPVLDGRPWTWVSGH